MEFTVANIKKALAGVSEVDKDIDFYYFLSPLVGRAYGFSDGQVIGKTRIIFSKELN